MKVEQLAASKEEFDQVIQEILAEKEYWYLNKEANQAVHSLADKLREWLEKLLSSRMDDAGEIATLSDTLSIVIIVILGIALIILIALIIKYVYESINERKKLDEILGEKITKETTPFTLLDKAKGFEAQGDYRMSIRFSYIGLLLLMHQEGLLYIEKSMTNAEIYECLKKENYISLERFQLIMEAFNYTWYGQNEYTIEAYEGYKVNITTLWNEVNINEKKQK